MKPWVVIVDYCWGARHISYRRPILSLNPRNRVPGSDWWTVSFGGLSVFVIPYFLLVCWLVCSFLDRMVLSTLLVLTGMSHLVEIPCWSSDSLGGSWWDEWPFILDWLNMPRPLICAVLLSLILAPLHLVENPGMRRALSLVFLLWFFLVWLFCLVQSLPVFPLFFVGWSDCFCVCTCKMSHCICICI